MKTRPKSYGRWSELPVDILTSVFERLSFVDFQRAKIVCSNWYSFSKHKFLKKNVSPWLILFPEETLFPDESCVLYNPEEDRVYKTKQDFSGTRFLANSGNWFLLLDSRTNLFIIDVFSGKRINLPPLESIKGGCYTLERVGNKKFKQKFRWLHESVIQSVEDLKCVLWVDDNKGEYVVAWCFDVRGSSRYIGFCKKGEDHYSEIPTQRYDVRLELRGVDDMVLVGYKLYVLTSREFVRVLDLSGQEGFKDVSESLKLPYLSDHEFVRRIATVFARVVSETIVYGTVSERSIAVTTSGEVLLVRNFFNKEGHRFFLLLKGNPNNPKGYFKDLNYLAYLSDEALLLDSGITVPADRNLGFESNSVYYTSDDRVRHKECSCLDICVFNLATKILKRFPVLSKLKLKDARWFLPQS